METYLTIEGLGDYLKIAKKTVRKWVLNQSRPERNIRKALESVVKEEQPRVKRYKVWLNWCGQFR